MRRTFAQPVESFHLKKTMIGSGLVSGPMGLSWKQQYEQKDSSAREELKSNVSQCRFILLLGA
jgi:hypothetical protein